MGTLRLANIQRPADVSSKEVGNNRQHNVDRLPRHISYTRTSSRLPFTCGNDRRQSIFHLGRLQKSNLHVSALSALRRLSVAAALLTRQ